MNYEEAFRAAVLEYRRVQKQAQRASNEARRTAGDDPSAGMLRVPRAALEQAMRNWAANEPAGWAAFRAAADKAGSTE